MFLYTSDDFGGALITCDEGELCWVDEGELDNLPMWEGDKIFFDLIKEDHEFFSLKLCYEGDNLVSAMLDGKSLII